MRNNFDCMKKVLMVMPNLPFFRKGACEHNRIGAMRLFNKLGIEVCVYAPTKEYIDDNISKALEREYKIKLFTTNSKTLNKTPLWRRLINPLRLDGAAEFYRNKVLQEAVAEVIEIEKPDYFWVDYTFLYPLHRIAKNKGLPVIVRSHNIEAIHFLSEDGFSFLNLLKFIAKIPTELISLWSSDYFFSISPREKNIYSIFKRRNVDNLPNASLPETLKVSPVEVKDNKPLNVVFMGSSYNIPHNRRAAEIVINEISSFMQNKYPGEFLFHITGAKLPQDLIQKLGENVIYHGFVDNLYDFLRTMDVSIIPTKSGWGMQNKIFEPLALGMPTICFKRGIGGYPFENGKEVFLTKDVDGFISCLRRLGSEEFRRQMAFNALHKSKILFNEDNILSKIKNILVELKT